MEFHIVGLILVYNRFVGEIIVLKKLQLIIITVLSICLMGCSLGLEDIRRAPEQPEVAVLVNWKIMIPFYMTAYGMPMEAVVGMATKALPFVDTEWKLLLCVTAPFNLLKGVVLSALTYVLYKHLSPLLHVKARG